MALYRGWDMQEVLQDGALGKESGPQFQIEEPVMSAFTPVNYSVAPLRFISPQKTLHSIDADTLYEIPDDPQPATTKTRKRGKSAANEGRAVSVGSVWEYRDEGDLAWQNNGEDFETSFPKRRKTGPTKRAKPTKPPKDMQHVPYSGELHGQSVEDADGSQSTTPPDFVKKARKKTVAKKPVIQSRKMAPFKNPVITKRAPNPQKTLDDEPTSVVIVSQRGWISTQESVKSNHQSVAQTTVNKLAGYMYRDGKSNPVVIQRMFPQLQIRQQPVRYPSQRDDGFFQDAAWALGQGVHQTENTVQSLIPQTSSHPLGDVVHSKAETHLSVMDGSDNPDLLSVPKEEEECRVGGISNLTPHNKASQPATDYGEPTSSEARELGNLIDATEPNLGGSPQVGLHLYANASYVAQHEELYNEQLQENIDVEEEVLEKSSQLEQEIAILQQHDHPFNEGTQHTPPHPSLSIKSLPAKRSNSDDHCDPNGKNVHHHDIDEFDEGFDDSEMWAAITDPATSSKIIHAAFHEQQLETRNQSRVTRESSPAHEQVLVKRLSTQHAPAVSFLDDCLDMDDDFPIDEDDTEEFLKLAKAIEQDHELIETPSSARPTTADTSPLRRQVVIAHVEDFPKDIPSGDEEDWLFVRPNDSTDQQELADALLYQEELNEHGFNSERSHPSQHFLKPFKPLVPQTPTNMTQATPKCEELVLDDSHEYEPLKPFARPDFPTPTIDRSTILGLSSQSFLRVCFRIGEMLKEGARCQALNQDVIIELFARVTFSSREVGTTKQHFQFADLWTERGPPPNGLLLNYKVTGLAETESKVFVDAKEKLMARCLGKLKRDSKSASGWLLHITNIRTTDWEEIKWTKRIVSAGLVKSETRGASKL